MTQALHEMVNIGKNMARALAAVGIATPEALKTAGSQEAFIRLAAAGVRNMDIAKLAALEGAIQDKKKYALDEATRIRLEIFYQRYTASATLK